MGHNRTKHRQHLHSGNLLYTGENETPTNVHFIRYSATGFHEQEIKDIHDIKQQMKPDDVHWIDVTGMNNPELIVGLVKAFGLNILDAKDILTPQHIVIVEEFDDNIFIVLTVVYYNKHNELSTEHMALILGQNYVISFRETREPFFENIYNTIKEHVVRINSRNADFLFASLLNEILTNYTDVISTLEDNLEELEDELLDIGNLKDNLITTIQEKRREMIRLRKILSPFKDQFPKLLRADKSLIGEKEKPYYKDINDQILYILQNLESCREIMSSLVDLYLNNNDVKMNFIMKRLTVVATIFIPLTFLVGVWGMNFKLMPELEWQYGYLFAWGIMLVTGIWISVVMKKRGWF